MEYSFRGSEELRSISFSISRILFFIGIAHLPITAFSYIIHDGTVSSFIVTNIVFLAFGLVFLSKESIDINVKQAMIISAIAWLLIPALSTIPFVMHGISVVDSYFESVSGWTTTGLTFIQDPSMLPPSLLLYRSFIQWVGGIGVVVFALLILKSRFTPSLFRSEREDAFGSNIVQTIRSIWVVYAILTIGGSALLALSGVGAFEALNLSMAGLSTGGFMLTPSLAHLSILSRLILALIMIAGATSIALFYWLFSGDPWQMLRNTEFRAMLGIMALGSLVIFIWGGSSLTDSIFHAISALSGTGFATSDLSAWNHVSLFALTLLMLVGGCSGSTSGALRVWRVIALAKSSFNSVKAVFLPKFAVIKARIDDKTLSEQDIIEVSSYFFLYISFAIFTTFGLMLSGFPLGDALFTSLSAQGNVGLASLPGWFGLADFPKIMLIISMWVGRLQIFPALILITQFLNLKKLRI